MESFGFTLVCRHVATRENQSRVTSCPLIMTTYSKRAFRFSSFCSRIRPSTRPSTRAAMVVTHRGYSQELVFIYFYFFNHGHTGALSWVSMNWRRKIVSVFVVDAIRVFIKNRIYPFSVRKSFYAGDNCSLPVVENMASRITITKVIVGTEYRRI